MRRPSLLIGCALVAIGCSSSSKTTSSPGDDSGAGGVSSGSSGGSPDSDGDVGSSSGSSSSGGSASGSSSGGSSGSTGGDGSVPGGVSMLASGQNEPSSLVVQGSTVYFTDQGTSTASAIGTIRSVPSGGGLARTLVGGQCYPSSIVADATNLYWTTQGGCGSSGVPAAVLKMPLGGGSPVTLLSASSSSSSGGSLVSALALAIDATNVYAADSPGGAAAIWKIPIGGGTPTALVPSNQGSSTIGAQFAAGAGAQSGGSVAVDGAGVYWSAGCNTSSASQGCIYKAALAGGAVTTLVTESPGQPTYLAIDSTKVYWADVGAQNTIKSVPLAGGTPATVAVAPASQAGGYSGLLVDANNVYLLAIGDMTIQSVPLGGGTPTTLKSTGAAPATFAQDATSLYWVDSGSVASSGTLLKAAK